jgi:hypothetical protein
MDFTIRNKVLYDFIVAHENPLFLNQSWLKGFFLKGVEHFLLKTRSNKTFNLWVATTPGSPIHMGAEIEEESTSRGCPRM